MGIYTDSGRTEQLTPLNLEMFLDNPSYSYIHAMLGGSSIPGVLENVALADPADYKMDHDYLKAKGGQGALRLYAFGLTSAESTLFSSERRHAINVMPFYSYWGRTTGVFKAVFGSSEANVYAYKGGLSFSVVASSGTSKYPTNNKFNQKNTGKTEKKEDAGVDFNWPLKGALGKDDEVRIFDGRGYVPFHMKDYRRLPRYPAEEIPEDSVVAVIFTVNRYVQGAQRVVNLSFNINKVVVLTDPVLDRPADYEDVEPLPWIHYTVPSREKKHI
uniref:Uncharacterized protein n=1 Tax=Mycena chlorophos TaxID=658473 RepID=A0ABQ0L2L7_MYCCL|nr:predicted protein [Mycena chlorophos]